MKYILFLTILAIFHMINGQINLGDDITLCEGETVTLDASTLGATNYLWSTGETTAQITISTSGIYSVSAGTSGTLNLFTNGGFDSQGTNWDFLGNFTEAYASELSYGGTNSANAVAEIDAGDDGVAGTTDDMSLSQNISGLIPGETYTLCFDYSIRTSGGPNPFEIELDIAGIAQYSIIGSNTSWNLQNICFTFIANTTDQLISLSPISEGFGGLGLVVDNFILNAVQGSQSSDEIEVTFVAIPTLNAGLDVTICQGSQVVLSGSGTATNYLWDNGVIDGQAFSPTLTTTYTVIGSNGACETNDQVQITVHDPSNDPDLNLGSDTTICNGTNLDLNAIGVWSSILWSDFSTNQVNSINSAGTYWCEVTNTFSCVFRDSIIVAFITNPTISILPYDTIACIPFEVIFQAISDVPNTNFSWNFGDNSLLENGSSTIHNYSIPGNYDVSITATAQESCTTTLILPFPIYALAQPVAAFSNNITQSIGNESTVQFLNNSLNYSELTWYFSSGNSSTEINPLHNFNSTEDASIQLTVTNGYCSDSTIQTINFPNNLIYYVPNTFTPDGNEYNNVFLPIVTEGIHLDTYHLRVFNKWGELMFESYDSKIGWDGTYNSKIVKSDTYLWSMKFLEKNQNELKNIYGHITLIK